MFSRLELDNRSLSNAPICPVECLPRSSEKAIWARLKEIDYPIPTLKTFFKDRLYLEVAQSVMKRPFLSQRHRDGNRSVILPIHTLVNGNLSPSRLDEGHMGAFERDRLSNSNLENILQRSALSRGGPKCHESPAIPVSAPSRREPECHTSHTHPGQW
jgi:hypothetical protein